MLVEITKRADGSGLLRCVRDDGSVTWQKQKERHAAFFALHDLTHFAVETTLGLRRWFFGLIQEGWEIEETDGKSARGPLPEDAGRAEWIVGMLDQERASGGEWSMAEWREYGGAPARTLSEDDLRALRDRRAELFRLWAQTPVGEALRLHYLNQRTSDS